MNFKKLTAYLDSFYAEKNIPGLGLSMYYRHKPVYEHYAGFSDVENQIPFGPETRFKLYSATKIATCTAALQLMEQGKFKLSDPLYEYIPEYRYMKVRHVDENGVETIKDAENIIQIEHLFSMSAGIDGWLRSKKIQQIVQDTDGRAPTLEVVKRMASEPLIFEPGTHFKYSSCHDALAGLVVAVSGKPLEQYLQDHVFGVIGMTKTTFQPSVEQDPNFAKLYVGFNGKTHTYKEISESFNLRPGTEYDMGGGGLYSTVPDYTLLTEALCNYGMAANGNRILKPETVDEYRKNRMTTDVMLADFEKMGGWSKAGYGYGLGVRTLLNRERNQSLSENGEFGWDGARGCYVLVDPNAEVALFYAQQEGGSPWWEWLGTVRNFAYASIWE